MSETALAYSWVVTTMQADSALVAAATGGVWQGRADIGVVAPYALVTRQGGIDALTLNAVRLFANVLLQIKAVGPTASYAALVTIAGRIDALFKSVRDTAVTGGTVLACFREEELTYDDEVNGAPWQHLGGLYHIQFQAS